MSSSIDINDDYKYAIRMRIVYADLPDLIEIETTVKGPEWSGVARAYTSPNAVLKQIQSLKTWCHNPSGTACLEWGADTGIGWACLRFYSVDAAGHLVCHVRLATNARHAHARDEEVWRLAIEIPTEPGLVERFAADLNYLIREMSSEAVLQGIAI